MGKPKGYALKGVKIRKTHESRLHSEWITTTIVTSIDPRDEAVTVIFRKHTNNQYDFERFIAFCIHQKVLRRNDTLIMDNARVYRSKNTFPGIQHGLLIRGINILFMPTYSPELNPCELVFAQVKKNIRETWIRDNIRFRECLFDGFTQVTRKNMINYYNKCRNLENITF